MLRTAIAASALALALVGCSGDPEPKFAEPSETTSSPGNDSSTPTPVKQESAEEFVGRWIAELDYLYTSGDGSEFSTLNAPACSGCIELVRRVQMIYDAGGEIEDPKSKITEFKKVASNKFDATFQVRSYRTRESADAAWEVQPAAEVKMRFELKQASPSWLVHNVVLRPL